MKNTLQSITWGFLWLGLALMAPLAPLAVATEGDAVVYDPLAITAPVVSDVLDAAVHDGLRQREIPIRVYLPLQSGPVPVIIFSHGLGGSREGSAYLGQHWAARGYVAVFLQHPGSDEAIWKDEVPARRMLALKKAANGQNFLLRVKDVSVVLDQLGRWNTDAEHALKGRFNLEKVGMSGHSFGAVTTQAVSGQAFAGGRTLFTDERIDAALIMSPSGPNMGSAQDAFAKVKTPWLLMTGSKDIAIVGKADMESRLAVFPALPPGNKYELVLLNAEHSAFTDRALPGDSGARNPNHHRVILALSTAFWDSYLLDDQAATTWLQGEGAKLLLLEGDNWQMK